MGVAVAVLASSTPTFVDTSSAQEDPGDSGDADATIEIAVDVASADDTELAGTIEELTANVAAQLQALDVAEAAVGEAERAVAAAGDAVRATEAEIAELTAQSDAVVVQAFVAPPSIDAIDALATDSAVDSAVKQSLLDMQADADASVLERLDDAQNRLEDQREAQRDAVAEAEARRADAEAALDDVLDASGQQAEFLDEVQDRLDQQLAEAAALEDLDPELAAQLRAEQEELLAALQAIEQEEAAQRAQALLEEARRREAEEAAQNPPDIGPPSGSLATVACPTGDSITVDSSVADNLRALLDAASGAGNPMCGGGYRSYESQVELRKAHCGTDYYSIYQAPASSCSPPTAKPGSSQHEYGLAIDFTSGGSTVRCGSTAHDWLSANAERYGLYQLPSECWHYSTTGN